MSLKFDEMNKVNPEKAQVPQQITSLTKKVNLFPGNYCFDKRVKSAVKSGEI